MEADAETFKNQGFNWPLKAKLPETPIKVSTLIQLVQLSSQAQKDQHCA